MFIVSELAFHKGELEELGNELLLLMHREGKSLGLINIYELLKGLLSYCSGVFLIVFRLMESVNAISFI